MLFNSSTNEFLTLFLASRKAKALSPDSVRWYRGILRRFAEEYPILPEEPEAIYIFLSKCQAGDERRHGLYRALRALYNFIERRFPSFSNPMRLVEAPRRKAKKPKPLTLEELNQLLSYPHPSQIKAALLFLADTGARVGEIAELGLNDISETPWGHIARITGKTGTRLVPISPQTYHALDKTLPFGYTKYRLRRLISNAFADAMVPGSGINLRHTFGTYWMGDELILQQIMGHSHLSTTKIYRELRTQRISEQHRLYSPLNMILGKRML